MLRRPPPGAGLLSPVVVVSWLWVGLVSLLLLYLRGLVLSPSAQPPGWIERLPDLWLGPTPWGLPVRHLIKLVNVLLALLLWLKWASLRSRRERRGRARGLQYLGTAALLLALEWGCHVFGESLRP